MKKTISLLLVFALTLSLFTGVTFTASALTDSGSCGPGLTWNLSGVTLTITGNGRMRDYSDPDDVPWFAYRTGIKTVYIGDSVTSIGDYAFYFFKALNILVMGNAVTSIGDCAFSDCYALPSVTLPNSLKSIGIGAFAYCSSLTSVKIPKSVTSIETMAFSFTDSMTEFTVDSENPNYSSLDGNLYNKDQTALIRYAVGKTASSFAVPNTVTSIERDAFRGCHILTSVTIPDSCKTIGQDAFFRCTALTSVDLGNSVETIGKSAFQSCESLTSVEIPNSVTSIEKYTFCGCESLTSVKIPNSVTSIGNGAFSDCLSLASVKIPDSCKTVGSEAFLFCESLSTVTLGSSVSSIGYGAFSDCTSLTDVYYTGSEADRAEISIDEDNEPLTDATWHYGPSLKLSTVNGAQIRTVGAQGLRFVSSLKKDENFSRVVEFGTLMLPTEDISNISDLTIGAVHNGHTVAKIQALNLYSDTDDSVTFTAVLTNIKEMNYARSYSARAYAILDDGTVVYAPTGASRSVYQVAKAGLENLFESGANLAIYQQIVDIVEN